MFTKLFGLSVELRFFINNNLKNMKDNYLTRSYFRIDTYWFTEEILKTTWIGATACFFINIYYNIAVSDIHKE